MNRLGSVVLAAVFALVLAEVPVLADLCQKHRGMCFIANVGKCRECGGTTSSGAFPLCKGCSARLGQCQACRAKLVDEAATNAPPVERPEQRAPVGAALPNLTVTGDIAATLDDFVGVAQVQVFQYDPRLADARATRIGNKIVEVKHSKGTAETIKAEFADLKPKVDGNPASLRYYAVVDVFADAAKTRRVMGTGEFCKIFERGCPDTVSAKLVPAN